MTERKFLTFQEAVAELESGNAIHRYGSAYPFFFKQAGYGPCRFMFSSSGLMFEGSMYSNKALFTAEETLAVDWQVWPKDECEAYLKRDQEQSLENQRKAQAYEEERAKAKKPEPPKSLSWWTRFWQEV